MYTSLDAAQSAHRACHRCVDAGFLQRAFPVFSGRAGQRILLVGQAPGPVELDEARPFAGRAGGQLMRWMRRAGFASDSDVRGRVYMTAMTTCFPGRRPGGQGDRRPSAREVALCSSWIDSVLELLQPRLILPVGSLALERFMPRRRLDEVVGAAYTVTGATVDGAPRDEPVLLPLPHPSGQSRWLNDAAQSALLDGALRRLQELVIWAESSEN
ncbi:MAG: uracil-DNA glycosylase family protein [Candidatus Dormibacteria bacterium]